jgi:chromosome segregation ATPase
LVSPGTYSVSLAKRVDGKLVDLGKTQTFEVAPLRDGGTLPGMTPEQRGNFEREYAEMSRQFSGARAVLRDTKSRVEAVRRALDRATVDETALRETARDLELRLAALEQDLSGNERRGMFNDEGPVSISDRFGKAGSGLRRTLAGPTQTHLTSYEIAKRQFADFKEKLSKIASEELPALETKLEEARIPWTPGRGIPGD